MVNKKQHQISPGAHNDIQQGLQGVGDDGKTTGGVGADGVKLGECGLGNKMIGPDPAWHWRHNAQTAQGQQRDAGNEVEPSRFGQHLEWDIHHKGIKKPDHEGVKQKQSFLFHAVNGADTLSKTTQGLAQLLKSGALF